LGIKQSVLIIIISVIAIGAVSVIAISLYFIVGLQSQVEELTKETKQQELQLESEQLAKEQQQRELEEQERQLKLEEGIRLQQQRELEEQERQLELQEGIRLQQQRELEEQERQLELQKRAQIEEMARTNPLVAGLIDGQLRFYIEPVPDYAADGVVEGVNQIVSYIEERDLSEMEFKRVYNENDVDIHISWIKNYGSHVLGEAIFKSVVKIGLGAENCYGDWQPFSKVGVGQIMFHEFGHSLGFGHSDNPDNIMYDQIDTRFETDYEKTIALGEGQYITLPFCSGGAKGYQVTGDKEFNGFYVYVLPPETDSKNFIELGVGQPYPDCSTENLKVAYGNTCTVHDGAKLVIYNPDDLLNFDVIRVDVMISSDPGKKTSVTLQWDLNTFEYDEDWLYEIWNMYH